MTRGDIINRSLKILDSNNSLNLASDARDWFENVLLEIESYGYWSFLEASTTETTVVGVGKYPFANFDINISTTYSKGIEVYIDATTKLSQVNIKSYDEMNDTNSGIPAYFAIWKKNLYLYPYPDNIYTLTIKYFKTMPLDNIIDDTINLNSALGMKLEMQQYLIDGVVAEGSLYLDTPEQDINKNRFYEDILTMIVDEYDLIGYKENKQDESERRGLI